MKTLLSLHYSIKMTNIDLRNLLPYCISLFSSIFPHENKLLEVIFFFFFYRQKFILAIDKLWKFNFLLQTNSVYLQRKDKKTRSKMKDKTCSNLLSFFAIQSQLYFSVFVFCGLSEKKIALSRTNFQFFHFFFSLLHNFLLLGNKSFFFYRISFLEV